MVTSKASGATRRSFDESEIRSERFSRRTSNLLPQLGSWTRLASLGLTLCCLSLASNASAQEANDLSFDDLVFEMEKTETFEREMLTDEIVAYNGTTIRLSGFIRPATQQDGITKFIFVRDNEECCFGPGAALFDCILVKLAKDESTAYTVRPITVRGEFLISEFRGPGDKIWAIYRMKNAYIE